MVGDGGLTPTVVAEADKALAAHGLIKVRVFSDERDARAAMLAQLADELSAAPVQHIGKLLVLWRPQTEPAAARSAGAKTQPGHGASREVKLVKHTKPGTRPTISRVTVHGNQRVTAGGLIKRNKKRAAVSVKKRAAD